MNAIAGSQLSYEALRETFTSAESKHDRLGLDYELMPYRLLDGGTVYYDRGVKPLMLALAANYNVAPILANHILTGVDLPVGKMRYGAGSQINVDIPEAIELDSLSHRLRAYLDAVVPVAQSLGLAFTSLAYHPDRDPASIQIISKQRYPVMQRRFRTSGTRGLHVMTCAAAMTVRVSVRNEKDAIEKFRAAVLLTPIIQALFANSPMDRGRMISAQSQRVMSWFDVDRARTSFFLEAFDPSMSYDRYIDWALNVPALGIDREGRAIDVGDISFKECLTTGKLYIGPEDWRGHLDTLWPAVRLTPRGLELRMADTGTPTAAMALLALVKGAIVEPSARKALLNILKHTGDFGRLPLKAARFGLFAASEHGLLIDQARAAVRVARGGLKHLDPQEVRYLAPLEDALADAEAPADEIRERYGRDWKDIHSMFTGTRII